MAERARARHRLHDRERAVSMDDLTPPEAPATGLRAQMLETLRDATLGEYEILMELGSGGMATVYLAHDLQLDRQVALKLLHPSLVQGQDMVERFILEARTAAKLSHPGIVPIHAVKVQEDLIYFVMKFIEGRPLDSIIREGAPLDVDMTRHVVMQMADALSYAHRHGVIHRDVKPANILISTDGHPILADFGIAKVADREGLTMTGATIGTPSYMSPEQCDAQALTGASDQYSLGVTAYEMLTGKPPFEAPSYMGILMKHMTEPARPVRDAMPTCPPDIAHVIDRMLAKRPADRFPELEQVVEALTPATAGKQQKVRTQLVQFALSDPRRERISRLSIPVSPIPTGSRRTRTTGATEPRRSSALGIATVVLAAMLGGAILVTRPWERLARPAAPTPAEGTAVNPPAPAAAAPAPQVDSLPAAEVVPPPADVRQDVRQDVRASGRQDVRKDVRASGRQGAPASGQPEERASGQPGNRASEPDSAPAPAPVVTPEAVAQVLVIPSSLSLAMGGSGQLTAHVTGSSGRELDRAVEWSSTATGVAIVVAGKVVAVGPGSTTITANSGGKSGSAAVTVAPPAPAAAAPPSEAELRDQVAGVMAAYGRALERVDMPRVRDLYPGVPQNLEQTLVNMKDLRVRFDVGQVQVQGDVAEVHVTGGYDFSDNGRRKTLPVDQRYLLERRGNGWVIVSAR